ncbi:phosphoenolpyruvate synthase [Candidatus Babeliales bacterium]|nr:phosphoenolpyruvate synthase [Candidatus Babeliales bacterium]
MKFIKHFESIDINDIPTVGGKNASLGEMIQKLTPLGIRIPTGFVVTANSYWHHLKTNKLEEEIKELLSKIDKTDLKEFSQTAQKIRDLIAQAKLPDDLTEEIKNAYHEMEEKYGENCDVAVRSSATAEDLPEASFAGQQETFLNIRGEEALLEASRQCFSSLFTDRAISYRIDHGFDHMTVALSVGIQKMIRSDLACAGVAFTLDTESGHKDVIFINASYGLGENVVKGTVIPDEFYVHKPTLEKGFKPILKKRLGSKRVKLVYSKNQTENIPVSEKEQKQFCLSDNEILELSKQSLLIEKHYSDLKKAWSPMDIEWAKDGTDGKLYILQARPETVHALKQEKLTFEEFFIPKKEQYKNKILVTGKSIGRKIVYGKARLIKDSKQMDTLLDGEILVTEMTDPDWEPIMKKAAGIVTNRGGRTCHAAIVSRELGTTTIVGTTNGTEKIKTGEEITLDCSSGEVGTVYEGTIPFEKTKVNVKSKRDLPVKIMINIGSPDEAFSLSKLPNDGVGLARLEFIIASSIQIHPMALCNPEKIIDKKALESIEEITTGYKNTHVGNKKQFFIDKLAQEAGTIAAAFYPKPVIIRLSDFKSNEYRQLIGGEFFEPEEQNPMLGFRGASRYDHEKYREAFALECAAMKKIRDEMGLDNIKLMIPFVRTVAEGKAIVKKVRKVMGDKIEIFMMCEVPSNVILIDQFSDIFDGFSIGSNDLTQMTLGVDRDSTLVAPLFDERDEAVKKMIMMAIEGAHAKKKPIGICGQAPSDYPEFTTFLIEQNIDSISLNPDAILKEIMLLGD